MLIATSRSVLGGLTLAHLSMRRTHTLPLAGTEVVATTNFMNNGDLIHASDLVTVI